MFLSETFCDLEMYSSFEVMVTHKRQAARRPDDRLRWGSDIDFLAAALLFNVNIHSHTGVGGGYNWQSYSPEAAWNASVCFYDVIRSHDATCYSTFSESYFRATHSSAKTHSSRILDLHFKDTAPNIFFSF